MLLAVINGRQVIGVLIEESQLTKCTSSEIDMFHVTLIKMFLGHLERAIGNCEQQPVFVFDFDVRTKMFHEEPYKNGATSVRNEYCRADHGDELMYMFGTAFLAEGSFEIAADRYFSEEEKNLQKRMMKAMGLKYLF